MEVIVTKNREEMSKRAAALIAEEIKRKPNALLALSTGSSPIGTYQELIRLHREEGLDFSKVRALNMDEYVGLNRTHPQGYYYFMEHSLYQEVNIDKANTFGPQAAEGNPKEEARRFDEKIEREGGIDLILLGIGRDGHIAFNMPAERLYFATHVQELSETAIQDNARFFDNVDQVPTKAMTIGIEHIFKSRKVILIAGGKNKSGIMERFINSGALDTGIPATVLRLHPDIKVILDEDAASDLQGKKG